MTTAAGRAEAKPPFWRDLRVLRVLAQVVTVAVVVTVLWILWSNLLINMGNAGLPTDFAFLTQPLGVDIAGSDIGPGSPVWKGLLVGIRNTLALVLVGVPLLTILGVVVGICRLSTNWLVAKLAAVYVEVLRNLPPLLILFFVFNAVFLSLPRLEDSWHPLGLFVINNRFIAVTGLTANAGFGEFWLIVGVALLLAVWVWIWRTVRSAKTGKPHHRVLWSAGLVVASAAIAFVALGRPIGISIPILDGRVLEGGFQGFAAYFAVLVALVLYTASHVAEIVRGSIQAVARGQIEAAESLALTPYQRLRLIVMPQAMRIAIPPTISQFLNFTKNTSLAIAIGYAEITRITYQTIGNGQPAPQLIGMLMAAYLLFSLTISLAVNLVNRRLRYVT